MIIKLLLLIIFNLIYTLNNYTGILSLIIMNTILFLCEIPLINQKIKLSIKKFVIAFIITIISIVICRNSFLYGYKDMTITITNPNSNPIHINGIYFNNTKQKLNNDIFNDNEYDIYNKLTNNYQIDLYHTYSFKTNKTKKITINFEKQNEPYSVKLNDNNIDIPASVIDHSSKFYKVNDNYLSYEISTLNYNNNYKFINIIISIIGLMVIILSILNQVLEKKFIAIFLALSLILFEFNDLILIEFSYKIILFIFVIICYLLLNRLKIKFRKPSIYEFLTCLIISFCIIGNLFLTIRITFKLILIFLLFTFWILYLINLVFRGYQYLKQILKSVNDSKYLDKIILFLIPLIIFLIYRYIYYPFIISTDGDMQMLEIIRGNYSNWHPFFHTLFMKFSYDLFGDFSAVIIIRIIVVSIIISIIGSYFIKRGIKRIPIYLLVIFFCLNPVTGIYMVSILKDVDYVICLILLTFLLIKYADNNFNKNILNYIFLAITLILIGLFRHNGLYVCLLFSLFLFILSIRKKDKFLFITPILVILFIGFYKLYIYPTYKVSDGLRNSDIVSLAHGLQAVTKYTNDIETEKYLETIMPIDIWKDTYNKYNIDIILHYNELPFRNVECSKFNVITLYLKKVLKYPNILIADRLYGTDILWNVFKSDFIQTYDYQIDRNEFGVSHYVDFNINPRNNKLKDIVKNYLLFISNNKIFSALFLRGGLYFCLMLVILFKEFDRQKLFILFPTILTIITLFIAGHHQSYRYVMFLPIIFILLILKSISDD